MRTVRPLSVWLLATALTGALVTGLTGALVTGLAGATVPAGPGFADLLVAGCALIGAAACLWLWVLVSLVLLDAVRERPVRTGVPVAVRRAVLVCAGLALTGGLAAPAGAADPGRSAPHAPGPETASGAALLVGLPLPDRTTTTSAWLGTVAERPARPGRARGTLPAAPITVTPGDSLWELASASLPGTPDDLEIARRWQEIYAANRSTIGADPDLIRPGQRLVLPGHDDA